MIHYSETAVQYNSLSQKNDNYTGVRTACIWVSELSGIQSRVYNTQHPAVMF